MGARTTTSTSIGRQFARDYLLISILPLVALFILALAGALIAENTINSLIARSMLELNSETRGHLRLMGEKIIENKARDVSRQVAIFLDGQPDMTMDQLQNHTEFRRIAMQGVGRTGYTCLYEARTGIMRIHPNPHLVDTEMERLSGKLSSFWAIFEPTLSGREMSGYYDWLEPDGGLREKYMAMAPVEGRRRGIPLMVAATTYIDEFSAPIQTVENRAAELSARYRHVARRQGLALALGGLALLLATFLGVYLLGRRAGLRYIRPIEELGDAVGKIGEGNWAFSGAEAMLGRTDEIGTLARAFADMSARVRELLGNLEDRLAELKHTQGALAEGETHYRSLYEASKRTEEVYRSLIHSSADAIVIYDMEGRVRYVSPVFTLLFGWTLAEVKGRRIPFLPDFEKEATLAIIGELLDSGTPCHGYESRRYTKAGRLIDVSISASRYDDHEGKPSGLLVILRDISGQKKLMAQLRHAERMESIGTLAGGIAHDFNNLMMGIQGNVSLMLRNLSPEHPHFSKLQSIEKSLDSGARLTGHLLGYARKGQYEIKPVNFSGIVRETAETFARTRREIVVHQELSGSLPAVLGDRVQMEQILMNLYINAADAMPEGGDLYLRGRVVEHTTITGRPYKPKPGRYLCLGVTDTGSGIDPQILPRIFDPFFTTKEMGRGTGLGLASSYGIVKAHGGYIDVSSDPGEGTTFTIFLPVSRDFPEEKAGAATRAGQGKGRILLVDDEEIVVAVGKEMLETMGYEVVGVISGREALDHFKNNGASFDLVIIDMIMPGMGGGELFDRIRRIDADARVLLSSGYAVDGQASEILSRGCDGFIQKPFGLAQLADKVKELMPRM
jgi:two-component system, cell cycle sensor histidine kinase and response regulator CckA